MKTLILTPNKNEMCGMYQLAKDLAKEFDGDISTRKDYYDLAYQYDRTKIYDQVITFLYPMHKIGKKLQRHGVKWICYDQKTPPATKLYFPNFWRRQAMKYINWRNNQTMQGADEYWDVTEREQKPRWTKKRGLRFLQFEDVDLEKPYIIYIGRTTDYKNYEWLKQIMNKLNIPLIHPEKVSDDLLCEYLSNAKILITASLWEGYGRPVMEAEALGIPAVSYDVGAHKRNTKKGICVPVDIQKGIFVDEEAFKEAIIEVWNR